MIILPEKYLKRWNGNLKILFKMNLWNWVQWFLNQLGWPYDYEYANLSQEEQDLLPPVEPYKPKRIRLKLY